MKRNPELIRNILLKIEANPPAQPMPSLECAGHTPEEVLEHVMLLKDGGFIEAFVEGFEGPCFPAQFWIYRMPWVGQEFLAKARNDTLWKKVVAQAEEKGMPTSISIINSLLEAAAEKYVGIE